MSDNEPTVEFRLTIPMSIHEEVQAISKKERRTTSNQYLKMVEEWLQLHRPLPPWGETQQRKI